MTRLYCFLIASLFVSVASAQDSGKQAPGLSAHTLQYLHRSGKGAPDAFLPGYIYKKDAAGKTFISALVKVTDRQKAEDGLHLIGAYIGTKAGNIWTVQVPVGKVTAFTKTQGIGYIQLDEPVFPQLDVVRQVTRTDSVHKGYDLPMPYSGKDVVVGIIDFGFDYNHPVFFDTAGAAYRVKKVWELNTSGTPPAGYNYGHEISGTTAILAQGTDNPEQTHGTAVAGIAAGSGFGSSADSNRFLGIAYESDIVLVGVRRDSIASQWMAGGFADFVDAINYIFNYAGSAGKPAVVNISWGSQSGPHDGTSLFNQACDNMSGKGRAIVMSAGNDGDARIHLSTQFTPADTVLHSFLTFTSNVYKRTWIDAWGDPGKSFCARITLYNNGAAGNATELVCTDDRLVDTFLISADGLDTCFVSFTTTAGTHNGKPRLIIDVYNKSADVPCVSLSGKDGNIHVWNEYYYYGYIYSYSSAFSNAGMPWARNGNTDYTVSDMGAAQSVLLVGAYSSKISWKDINNQIRGYSVFNGRIAPFSSKGPMVDGRIKPDIGAPGLTLATGVSSYDTAYTATGASSPYVVSMYEDPRSSKKYYYAEFIGTSASAPVATGIVALMLQANPDLGPEDIRQIIRETAITDIGTGNLPPGGNNTWGAGKINAYAAVKRAVQKKDIYTFSGKKLDCVLFPNPNNGSFMMEYTTDAPEQLALEVRNVTGSLVKSAGWKANAGMNRMQIDIPGLADGIYLVKLTGAQGSVLIKTLVRK